MRIRTGVTAQRCQKRRPIGSGGGVYVTLRGGVGGGVSGGIGSRSLRARRLRRAAGGGVYIPGLVGYGRRRLGGARSPFGGRSRGGPPAWSWVLLLALLAWGIYPWVTEWREGGAPGGRQITIWLTDTRKLVELPLEAYVMGVVAAEMPASFHPEALAAQAVAARTYAVRAMRRGQRVDGHPGAVLTDRPEWGQGWLSKEELRMRWGFRGFRKYWRKIETAVERTSGLVAVYKGELIDAVYHSDSGGRTESARYYWSAAVPYLQSVSDPYGSHSPYRETERRLSFQTAASELGLKLPSVGGDGGPVIEVVKRSPAGRALKVRVGSEVLTGRTVRERLDLRSNWFDVSAESGEITFIVRGNGHGVGMSQYGADGMGRSGYTYEAILKHYFTGIDLVRMEQM